MPSDSFSFTDLEAGAYTFVVTDAKGCTASDGATALGNTIALSFVAVGPVSCNGDSDGVIGICVDGGIAPLSAAITPAIGNYIGSSGNCSLLATFTSLPPGAYNVTVTDAGGFTATTGISVTEPEPVVVNATNQGDTIIATVTGGTFSYEYSIDGTNWQASPVFPGLPDGAYTVYARDIKLCSDSTEFVLNTIKTIDLTAAWGVTVAPNPGTGLFHLNLQEAPATLHGDIFDMTGRSLRRLDFSPGQGAFSTKIDIQDLPQGIYILRLTDGASAGSVRLSVVR
jgi:hypothetical protein